MTAIILDDEIPSAELLHLLMQKYNPEIDVLAVENKVDTAIDKINYLRPDLIFLDIRISNILAFDILEKIEGSYKGVIFTTAYEEYAVKSYKLGAVDYLLKPIDHHELTRSIQKAQQNIKVSTNKSIPKENAQNKIAIPTSKGVKFIAIEEIIRLEASKTYTFIHLQNGNKILSSKNIGKLEEQLNGLNHFYRTHKSHLINLQFISEYHKDDGGIIILGNGDKVPVSRDKKKGFLEMISL